MTDEQIPNPRSHRAPNARERDTRGSPRAGLLGKWRWNIGVDTGGTFTDCVARHVDGGVARSKVLSTSAIRGVVGGGSKDFLVVEFNRQGIPNTTGEFFTGFTISAVHQANADKEALACDQEETDDFRVQSARRIEPGRFEFHLVPRFSTKTNALEAHPPGSFVDLVAPFQAPILAARLAIDRPFPLPLDDCRICIGTTRGTNALLQGRVSGVTLFVNDGMEDLLRIGDQRRLDIFARAPSKPPALERRSIGLSARMAFDGKVLTQLDERDLRLKARHRALDSGAIAAVALLHSAVNSEHEQRVGQILKEEGFTWISLSHQCGSTSRFEPRARAAVVDAALSGPVGEFITAIQRAAAGAEILMMTSAGGLAPIRAYSPRESLLSGPSGGVACAGDIAKRCGFDSCVTLDMGGTSTDVARVHGAPEMRDETTVHSVSIASPCVAVESVAAGGGSLLWWDGETQRVGPRSAGADPGPACYGAGGPLTLTDAHLILGHIDARMLPIPISIDHALDQARELHRNMSRQSATRMTIHEMLEGFIAIADESMASAIRTVTVRKGVDPSNHALVAFGGAGGLHACSIARQLGIRNIVLPADAGLLCAGGISQAPVTKILWAIVLEELDAIDTPLSARFDGLFQRAKLELEDIGMDPSAAVPIRRVAMMRLKGQEESLEIELPKDGGPALQADSLRVFFRRRFLETYGFAPDAARPIELERIRLQVEVGRGNVEPDEGRANGTSGVIVGPAAIHNEHSTAFVAEGWSASTHASGATVLSLNPLEAKPASNHATTHELLAARLGSIATDMGEQLRRTAVSPNIKDRLDFSCGLLDADGFLVVNAPHIPIHLGALGVCVREVGRVHAFAPGQVWVVNHPRFGGSHLPDLTVITPIFSTDPGADPGEKLIGFAANRAHHAEMGGARPGSMPPDATTLAEEGVVIEPTLIVENGVAHLDRVERQLRSGPWPSRMVTDNLGDIAAQIAANELAVVRMRELVLNLALEQGSPRVNRKDANSITGATEEFPGTVPTRWRLLAGTCERLRASARMAAERSLLDLPAVIAPMEERLDDGTALRVRMRRTENPPRLEVDFTGTSPQQANNLNAPRAVTRAAVMYCMRVLAGRRLGGISPAFPMNEGLLDPVEIILPERSILNPDFSGDPQSCPACAIGQTETSQRLVDLLWRAFNLAACSQGTINNLLFGNDRFGFYETIAGGAGATELGDGASGVHTHISNTRITDAEVLERRYPVRLERFSIRPHSGGDGKFRGGDGLLRRLRFLQAVDLSFLSQHRIEAPYGLNGGSPGARGAQRILRADGARVEIPGIVAARMEAGDAIEIETPGGGGFGPPNEARESHGGLGMGG